MPDVVTGKKVPDFTLPSTGDQQIRLSKLKGQNVVLYFYPKDSTPGCTQEGLDFNCALAQFKKLNTEIFGISRDSLKSHENFKTKQSFSFDLLADTDEVACKLFDVIKEKNMYGKKILGIERSTFLIDAKGILRKEWRKVKVKDHVADVLQTLQTLDKTL